MIRHMVHLRLGGISSGDKAILFAGLAALRGHLHGILDFKTYGNISPETPVVHGFTDLFWFDFSDVASRDAYLIDPDHQAMGARLVAAVGGLDGLLVCDIAL